MELDELKNQLKQKLQAETGSHRTAEDFAALLKNNTRSVVNKIRRSLRIETLLSSSLAAASTVVICVADYWPTRVYFGTFLVLSLLFCLLLGILLHKIDRLNSSPLPVKENLENIYGIVQLFARRYYQLGMALFPLCLLFAYILNYIDLTRHDVMPLPFSFRWKQVAALLPCLVLFAYLLHITLKWYNQKMFGRYLEQLKTCIAELEEA